MSRPCHLILFKFIFDVCTLINLAPLGSVPVVRVARDWANSISLSRQVLCWERWEGDPGSKEERVWVEIVSDEFATVLIPLP